MTVKIDSGMGFGGFLACSCEQVLASVLAGQYSELCGEKLTGARIKSGPEK